MRASPSVRCPPVGESNCGKSTLARALVRLLKPASERIVLDGTDLAQLPERRLRPLRRRVQAPCTRALRRAALDPTAIRGVKPRHLLALAAAPTPEGTRT